MRTWRSRQRATLPTSRPRVRSPSSAPSRVCPCTSIGPARCACVPARPRRHAANCLVSGRLACGHSRDGSFRPSWPGGSNRRHASLTQRPECRPVQAGAAGSNPARRARSRKPLRLHRCRTDGCEPIVRRVFDIPSWRNWQTRLAQNQESRDVSVRIGPRGPVHRVGPFTSTLGSAGRARLDQAGVAGSEPAASTNFPITHLGVAQLAAHRVWDARVAGSNPAAETIRSMVHVAQWEEHRVVIPVAVGSNPTMHPTFTLFPLES